jgi:hypothetical protein
MYYSKMNFSLLHRSYRNGSGRPNISRTFRFRVIPGAPPAGSSQFVNSPIVTLCSICTFLIETVTVFSPLAMPSTHSFPRSCLRLQYAHFQSRERSPTCQFPSPLLCKMRVCLNGHSSPLILLFRVQIQFPSSCNGTKCFQPVGNHPRNLWL